MFQCITPKSSCDVDWISTQFGETVTDATAYVQVVHVKMSHHCESHQKIVSPLQGTFLCSSIYFGNKISLLIMHLLVGRLAHKSLCALSA